MLVVQCTLDVITKAGLGYEALRIITPKTPKVPKRSQKQQNSTKTTKVHQKTTKTSQNTKKSQKKSQKSHQRHRKSPIDHCNKPEQITVLLFTPADCVWIRLDHPDSLCWFVRSFFGAWVQPTLDPSAEIFFNQSNAQAQGEDGSW